MPRSGSVVLLLLIGFAVLPACGSEETQPPVPTYDGKFAGQAIAVVPFDPDNPACEADPRAMDRATLASCIGMKQGSLPADYRVVEDLASFDPQKRNASILILPRLDDEPAPWYALVAFEASGSVLAPRNVLLAGAGTVTVVEGLEAAGIVLAPEVVLPALAVGGGVLYLVNRYGDDIAKGTNTLIKGARSLLPCSGGYFCVDSRPTYKGGCDGLASGSPCTYADANGTTYGSGSGFCGGTRTFSSTNDGTNRCVAQCTCRSNVKGR